MTLNALIWVIYRYLGIRVFIVRKCAIHFLKARFFKIEEAGRWEIKTHASLFKFLAEIYFELGKELKKS